MKNNVATALIIGILLLSSCIILPAFNLNTIGITLSKRIDTYNVLSQKNELKKVTDTMINSDYPCSFSAQLPITSNDTFEYVIITNRNLKNSRFQDLITHKSQYMNATIVTLEDILSDPRFWVDGIYGDATNTSHGNPWVKDGKEVKANFNRFNDTQAKIRNFIRYAHQQWETNYVLLGGDVKIIPVRKLRINKASFYTGYIYIPVSVNILSDVYYASLNGTWNNDFDRHFGEAQEYSTGEEADFFAEVYIGRVPVDGKKDVKTFVDKVIHFETTIKPNNIQLHQSGINRFNIPDTTVVPEACARWIPDSYDIYKLYDVNEKVTKKKWINCFQEPEKLIVLHIGSGQKTCYYLDKTIIRTIKFSKFDVNKLTNSFFPIHISIACDSGNFGGLVDCLAERLLLCPTGGPSACLFNSFFGFATHHDSHKYSGEFIERQFYEIFQNRTENLGKSNQFAKEHFVSLASIDQGYRWCYYTVSLLGDPEMPIFETRNKLPSSTRSI